MHYTLSSAPQLWPFYIPIIQHKLAHFRDSQNVALFMHVLCTNRNKRQQIYINILLLQNINVLHGDSKPHNEAWEIRKCKRKMRRDSSKRELAVKVKQVSLFFCYYLASPFLRGLGVLYTHNTIGIAPFLGIGKMLSFLYMYCVQIKIK